MHGAPHRVVHFPDGHIVLVQYESVPVMFRRGWAPSMTNPTDSLKYFTNLYREMGFHEVEGVLVYLANEPDVVKVV